MRYRELFLLFATGQRSLPSKAYGNCLSCKLNWLDFCCLFWFGFSLLFLICKFIHFVLFSVFPNSILLERITEQTVDIPAWVYGKLSKKKKGAKYDRYDSHFKEMIDSVNHQWQNFKLLSGNNNSGACAPHAELNLLRFWR